MKIFQRIGILAGFYLIVVAGLVQAETIELVTYYPAPGSTGDQRVRSLTVGTGYQGSTCPLPTKTVWP